MLSRPVAVKVPCWGVGAAVAGESGERVGVAAGEASLLAFGLDGTGVVNPDPQPAVTSRQQATVASAVEPRRNRALDPALQCLMSEATPVATKVTCRLAFRAYGEECGLGT
jgi:hypothetical protein